MRQGLRQYRQYKVARYNQVLNAEFKIAAILHDSILRGYAV